MQVMLTGLSQFQNEHKKLEEKSFSEGTRCIGWEGICSIIKIKLSLGCFKTVYPECVSKQ